MKIKMLPNWCKKLGVIIFLFSFVISATFIEARESFYKGYNEANPQSNKIENFEPILIEKWFGPNGVHSIEVLIILGLLMYLLSKEKIEDDYINILRLESYQLTSLIALGITILLYTISSEIKLTLDYFIILFLLVYLITFALKKRQY